MSKNEIFEKLLNIFSLVVGSNNDVTKITLKTKILTELGLSSVALVYMVFAIEKQFNISLSKITYHTFDTVEDVVDLIYTKIH